METQQWTSCHGANDIDYHLKGFDYPPVFQVIALQLSPKLQ